MPFQLSVPPSHHGCHSNCCDHNHLSSWGRHQPWCCSIWMAIGLPTTHYPRLRMWPIVPRYSRDGEQLCRSCAILTAVFHPDTSGSHCVDSSPPHLCLPALTSPPAIPHSTTPYPYWGAQSKQYTPQICAGVSVAFLFLCMHIYGESQLKQQPTNPMCNFLRSYNLQSPLFIAPAKIYDPHICSSSFHTCTAHESTNTHPSNPCSALTSLGQYLSSTLHLISDPHSHKALGKLEKSGTQILHSFCDHGYYLYYLHYFVIRGTNKMAASLMGSSSS